MRLGGAALLGAMLVAGCDASDVISGEMIASPPKPVLIDDAKLPQQDMPIALQLTDAARRQVASQNRLGTALFLKLAEAPGNLFFSPASLNGALAMAQPGARGKTAKEFQTLLGNDGSPAALKAQAEAFSGMSYHVQGRSLLVKNAVWVDKSMALKPVYQATLKADFNANIARADFVGQREQARAAINRSAEESTFGRITDLIAPDDLTQFTRLVLVNTAFFRARWQAPFPDGRTSPKPFFRPDGTAPNLPMMTHQLVINHLAGEGFQAVSIPFEGETEMIVFLPKEKQGLAAFEAGLNGEKLERWIAQLNNSDLPWDRRPEIILSLPKFTQQDRRTLDNPLRELGMVSAFNRNMADFSGMAEPSDSYPLFISKIIQQSWLAVDEEGAEAAAATAMFAEAVSAAVPPAKPEPIVFKADHPFFYLIRDTRSGMILFMGRFLGVESR